MAHTVTLIPGDGTGPEVARAVQRVVDAAGVQITWDEHHLHAHGSIPPAVIDAVRASGTALMGYHQGHRDRGAQPAIVRMRRKLGLFANHRPVMNLKGIPSRYEGVDLLLIRETTEDIYAALEHESIAGVYESLKVTTTASCERILRHAFEFATAQGRKRVTIVHKANIMKLSDGTFLRMGKEIAKDYPSIEANDVIVDALCMKLVANPHQFDVLVAGNLFGDIVGDVCAGLVGGVSNCPSINVGDGVVVYHAPHGEQNGKRGVNPLTLMHAARVMLRRLGEGAAADRLRAAMQGTLTAGIRPEDLGGTASCSEVTDAIVARL